MQYITSAYVWFHGSVSTPCWMLSRGVFLNGCAAESCGKAEFDSGTNTRHSSLPKKNPKHQRSWHFSFEIRRTRVNSTVLRWMPLMENSILPETEWLWWNDHKEQSLVLDAACLKKASMSSCCSCWLLWVLKFSLFSLLPPPPPPPPPPLPPVNWPPS